jgi:FMN phosphatase YigB (HAD superfamily)
MMIRAVLVDLDDTLIHNPDADFAAAFLNLADAFLAPRLKLQNVQAALRYAIQQLTEERLLIENNLQLVCQTLAEAAGQPFKTVQAALDAFYTEDYPQLCPLVAPIADSQTLINTLIEQQITVVIAANPIHPLAGINQRLAWGKVDASRAALITDASTMHFAKPDPAYYAEIIARVGVEPDEALMVGDHPIEDIQAAEAVGLRTLKIDPSHPQRLQLALELFSSPGWRSAWPTQALTPTAILHALRGNLGALAGLVEQAPPSAWHQHPLADEWSLAQIMTHLAQSEADTQRARIETILHHQDTTSLPLLVDRPGDRDIRPLHGVSLPAMFEMFVQERYQTLKLLKSLAPADWARKAHHSVFGYTTLCEMAAFTAQHDRMHIQQFCQTLGRCSDE